MRKQIANALNEYDEELYFLHCDAWHFKLNPNIKLINCGVQEPNMVNIALGLLLKGKNVVIYSIAGFVLERCIEQFRLYYKNIKGKFIFLEAGAHEEYPKELGEGHSFGNHDYNHLLQYLNIFNIIDLNTVQNAGEVCLDILNKDYPKCNILLLGKDL